LKARGYRIVHVVPATPERPATVTEPQQWQLHPTSETVAISHWPKIPNFVFTNADTLPSPALPDMAWHDEQSLARHAPWPGRPSLPQNGAAIALPVPGPSVFEIQEKRRAAVQEYVPSSHRAERTATNQRETVGLAEAIPADAGPSRRAIPGSPPIRPSGLREVPGTR
jgi:hypothetical protein